MKIIRYIFLILDASFIDLFRNKSKYKKRPLSMTWKDFWELSK